jgi:tetratricopeptide (TPR) repeat protein
MQSYPAAITDCTSALDIDPYFELALFYRAAAYSFDDQKENAIADYERLIELEPNNADHYERLGVLYVRLQRYDEAISYFEQYMALVDEIPPDFLEFMEGMQSLADETE